MDKPIAISKLASYAADPETFERQQGKASNVEAARDGIAHHNEIGLASFSNRLFGVIIKTTVWLTLGAVILFLFFK